MNSKISLAILTGALLTLSAGRVQASPSNINWLDMSTIQAGGAVSSNSIFNLPGYGSVKLSYTSTIIGWERNSDPTEQNGSASITGNTYSWGKYDEFNGVNLGQLGSSVTYTITYTFLNGSLPAGMLVLGTAGLGRRDLTFPSNITEVDVSQNGTFLGDFDQGLGDGATDFAGGSNHFSLINSVPGPTSSPPSNPWGNTNLGVTLIDDSVSSLTLNVKQIGADGIGFSVGIIATPEPSSLALLGFGGIALLRRRQRAARVK